MSRRLHDVSNDFLALEALLMESGGELTPTIEAWMAENDANLEQKADAYAALITEWTTESKRWSTEADRYAAHAKTLDNSAKRLKERLNEQLITIGKAKVETPRFAVAVQQNGTPSMAVEAAAIAFPAEYVTPVPPVEATIIVNTDALRDAFKAALPPKPKLKPGEEIAPGPKRLILVAVHQDDGTTAHHFILPDAIQPGDVRLAAFEVGTHVRIR